MIRHLWALLTAVVAFIGLDTAPAHADGASAGADIHVAQSLGDRELTVVLRRVDTAPGPLRIDVITHTGSPPGSLLLRLPGEGGAGITLRLGATPGTYGGILTVSRTGPQELLISDGVTTASIPFVLPANTLTPAENLTYFGFAAAGLLLAGALATAVFARRGWVAYVPAAGFVAAVAVAITAATLSKPVPAAAITSGPPVTMLTRHTLDEAGGVQLALSFLDSGSGRPVDDLVVQDAAFIHLLVITPGGRLRHLHPVRVAPGEYRLRMAGARAGHYALSAELTRRGGGPQLLRSPIGFDVAEPGSAVTAADDGQIQVPVAVTGKHAGEPTTMVVRFSDRPDLQPWLGMMGHLIAIGPLPPGDPAKAAQQAPVWAHVHAMSPPPPAGEERPDESVAAYGPEVSFTHTFPLPGRYQIWAQAQRGYALMTAPVALDIGARR